MAGNSKTAYAAKAVLNAVLRGTQMPNISQARIALFTSDPGESGAGAEVSGGAYTRMPLTFSAPVDITPSGSQCTNSVAVQFEKATAAWGIVTHVAIMDAATGGNMWYYGPMSESKNVGMNDRITFDIGTITVVED